MLAYRGLRLQLILRLYATWPAMHHMGVQTTNPKPRARPHHRSLANKELLSLGAATATFLEAQGVEGLGFIGFRALTSRGRSTFGQHTLIAYLAL